MEKDKVLGILLLIGSVAGILIYGWLLMTFNIIVLQITAFLGVALILGILAWIGWTMATTPSPTIPEAELGEGGEEGQEKKEGEGASKEGS